MSFLDIPRDIRHEIYAFMPDKARMRFVFVPAVVLISAVPSTYLQL
jgi:hypothetical protein